MNKTFLHLTTIASVILFSYETIAKEFSLKNQSQVKAIFNEALQNKSSNTWHITNLHSKDDNSFFVPYHLWSGSNWDGNKNTENCMHDVKKNGFLKEVIEKERTEYPHLWIIKCQKVVKL